MKKQKKMPVIAAVIPARGGSKGLPGKNLKKIGGLSLIARSVRAAIGASSVSRVAVSTDDAAISEEALLFGAEVIDRPAEFASDTATSESALLHALEHWGREGFHPDYLLFLQCTSPLTTSQDIEALVSLTLESNADSAFTGVPFHGFIWQADASGNYIGVNHDKSERLRRQDRNPELRENGAAYLMEVAAFREIKHRFFGKTVCLEMGPEQAVEIDDAHDLELIRRSYKDTTSQSDVIGAFPEQAAAVVFDFDGVFTDNTVIVSSSGGESVTCSRGDGMAISRFKEAFDGELLILSSEKNPVVLARANKLNLTCIHGVGRKIEVLKQWCIDHNVAIESVIYLGNDMNDYECLQAVGCGVVVMDAVPSVKKVADLVLESNGGHGAVRELLNLMRIRYSLSELYF